MCQHIIKKYQITVKCFQPWSRTINKNGIFLLLPVIPAKEKAKNIEPPYNILMCLKNPVTLFAKYTHSSYKSFWWKNHEKTIFFSRAEEGYKKISLICSDVNDVRSLLHFFMFIVFIFHVYNWGWNSNFSPFSAFFFSSAQSNTLFLLIYSPEYYNSSFSCYMNKFFFSDSNLISLI